MINCIGIRKETKDSTQQRAPLSPDQIRVLTYEQNVIVLVEPWEQRIYNDDEYEKNGAILTNNLSQANIIFGVKEIEDQYLEDNQAYCFFSHTIKGQLYNMSMLRSLMKRKDTLFDYELVKNTGGKRLIFFGDFAGYAGMIDSFWALGKRLEWEGIDNPFTAIQYATQYHSLLEVEKAFRQVGEKIKTNGLPKELTPFICGFTGYGNVSTAAQYLFDLLPCQAITPDEIKQVFEASDNSNNTLYKVQFSKPDLYQNRKAGTPFNLEEFNTYPEQFTSRLEQYLRYCTMLINGIYWEPRFPRLVTKRFMEQLYKTERHPRLRVIGDITCDIEGSIEITVKETNSENPIYVFEPLTGVINDGWKGNGPVVLSVDKLPTELPKEASDSFGESLLPFVHSLANADFTLPLESLKIPAPFKDALILHQGKLTPQFEYLDNYLKQ